MSHPVKYYHSAMAGAPVLSNNWGDLNAVLYACLVTGFNSKTITTITSASGVATATTSGNHTYAKDQVISIEGCAQAEYNGEKRVVDVTATTFTFAVTGTPTTPATTTSSITCKVAPLGWERAFNGTNKAAYRSKNLQSNRHYLRVDDGLKADAGHGAYNTGWAKWANVGICETMTDIDTITGAQAPFNPSAPTQNWKSVRANQWGWFKWYYARRGGYDTSGTGAAGARNWLIVGDDKFFYIMNTVAPAFSWGGRSVYCFGDFASFKPGDAYNTILKAHNTYMSNTPHFSYPFQYASKGLLQSLSSEGVTVLRNHTQLGNPVGVGATSLNTNNSNLFNGRGNVPFPNGADFALWLLPVYLRQDDGNMRGILPGLRWIPHNRPLSDMTIIDNVVGEDGKKFILPKYSLENETEYGQVAIDITGPWS